MKLAIAGIVLAMLGAFVMFKGLSYDSQRSVIRVGDLHVSADELRTVPAWVGGVAIVGGVLLVAVGIQGRRRV
jgi:prolipoprotein diacylglyceryltransferase